MPIPEDLGLHIDILVENYSYSLPSGPTIVPTTLGELGSGTHGSRDLYHLDPMHRVSLPNSCATEEQEIPVDAQLILGGFSW